MAHLWSGRFEGDPDAALFEFGASFRFDRRLFEDDVTGSRAWAEALERAGVLSHQDAAAIRTALHDILAKSRSDPAFFATAAAASDEDVHSFVERELVARVGDAGRRLHTGRSRNEQVSLDLRLYSEAPRSAASAPNRRARARAGGPGGSLWPGADAVLHASSPRPAGACRSLLPRARRGVPTRPLALCRPPD